MRKSLHDILVESGKTVVYIEQISKNDRTIWVAYSEGSGIAVPLRGRTYFTNLQSDENYDPNLIRHIRDFSDKNKPLKRKGNSKMYELPIYEVNTTGGKFDIWGGEIKPIKVGAFVINEASNDIVVINLFETKREAQMWLKTQV